MLLKKIEIRNYLKNTKPFAYRAVFCRKYSIFSRFNLDLGFWICYNIYCLNRKCYVILHKFECVFSIKIKPIIVLIFDFSY